MSEKLKPCPFCGGEGVVYGFSDYDYRRVICKDCGGSTEYSDTREKAIEAWNRRVNT